MAAVSNQAEACKEKEWLPEEQEDESATLSPPGSDIIRPDEGGSNKSQWYRWVLMPVAALAIPSIMVEVYALFIDLLNFLFDLLYGFVFGFVYELLNIENNAIDDPPDLISRIIRTILPYVPVWAFSGYLFYYIVYKVSPAHKEGSCIVMSVLLLVLMFFSNVIIWTNDIDHMDALDKIAISIGSVLIVVFSFRAGRRIAFVCFDALNVDK